MFEVLPTHNRRELDKLPLAGQGKKYEKETTENSRKHIDQCEVKSEYDVSFKMVKANKSARVLHDYVFPFIDRWTSVALLLNRSLELLGGAQWRKELKVRENPRIRLTTSSVELWKLPP